MSPAPDEEMKLKHALVPPAETTEIAAAPDTKPADAPAEQPAELKPSASADTNRDRELPPASPIEPSHTAPQPPSRAVVEPSEPDRDFPL